MEKYEKDLERRIENEFLGTDDELKMKIDNFSLQLENSEKKLNEVRINNEA